MQTSIINNNLGKYIDQLINSLNIGVSQRGNYYSGCCCIHGGDNPTALCIYEKDGRYSWKCFTRGCQQNYGRDLLGLIRAILSSVSGKKVSFPSTLQFANNFLNGKVISLEIPKYEAKKQEKRPAPISVPLDKYLNNLRTFEFPSSYYIRRGYSKEILKKFSIAINIRKESKFYTRSIVPFIENDKIIGFTGRSFYDIACSFCGMYHSPYKECPHTEYAVVYGKWRTLKGFYIHDYLYGDWLLEPGRYIILVEGPGDVWRLHEAGFENSVSICGCGISDVQIDRLKEINNKNIIVALDCDLAGQIGNEKVAKKLRESGFSVETIKPFGKDWGDTPVNEIKSILKNTN